MLEKKRKHNMNKCVDRNCMQRISNGMADAEEMFALA